MDGVVVLQGPRVTVRPVRRDDLPYVLALWTNPAVMRPVRAEGLGVTLADLETRYWPRWERPQPTDYRQHIVERDGAPIGEIGFRFEETPGAVSVDIKIGDPALWGQGLGTEAMGLLVDHLFRQPGVERIVAYPGGWNERSLGLFRRFGFRVVASEDLPPDPVYGPGTMVTVQLDRAEWEAAKA